MIRSLRKGVSLVYFEYSDVEDSIYADRFKVNLNNDEVTLCFQLKPADGNQKNDEEHLHECLLRSVTLDDKYIINNLTSFLKNKSISSMKLKIISQGKTSDFNVKAELQGSDTLKLLIV